MTSVTELRAALAVLNLKQRYAAGLFGTSVRNLRRWRNGQRPVPFGIAILVRLLRAGAVTLEGLEQAATLAKADPEPDGGGADPESAELSVAQKLLAIPDMDAIGRRAILPAPLLGSRSHAAARRSLGNRIALTTTL
jgi:hypothetical protein